MDTQSRIEIDDISYHYEDDSSYAVNQVTESFAPGEFVAILGHNGSGKSTLAKLLNALYLPTQGRVLVMGMDTKEEAYLWDVRQHAGMIFQNPDNQIVATVVREDVAFGLENMGVAHDEMVTRIDEALEAVQMTSFAEAAPHMLSGGQKQRVAIAGILAMKPDIIIADEATAMLDPSGRKEVLNTMQKLNRDNGITVLWITHFMEEAALCDRVLVMHEGRIEKTGTPKSVFSDVAHIKALHLDVPPMTELVNLLTEEGYGLPQGILTVDEMLEEVEKLLCQSK